MTPVGENKYPMIVRQDFSLFARVYLIDHTFDATEAFKNCLADLKVRRYSGIQKSWWYDQMTAMNSTKENSESFAYKEI